MLFARALAKRLAAHFNFAQSGRDFNLLFRYAVTVTFNNSDAAGRNDGAGNNTIDPDVRRGDRSAVRKLANFAVKDF